MNHLKFSQRGMTLIEILIALALSIIIILAMLRAFVTTGKVTAEASLGAKVDSNIMLGLIATDRILQGVGYSINNHVPKAYAFSNDVSNIEYLVWKISDNKCRALRNYKATDSNADNGLYIYGTEDTGYSCDDSLNKPDLTTNPAPTAERLIRIENTILTSGISDASNKIGAIKIELDTLNDSQRCMPFGAKYSLNTGEIAPVGGKYQVAITVNTYAASTDTPKPIRNVTCLFNFK
ncbi:prepilin-type N-terminal cleavage/methylation domain-containing protein [Acinetobacter sp. ANC 5380]|uniref:Prepilin-type N-terminal cleavage/methylation domain-containing protein n=1 Tax=Acinetobacter terrae TaxID=2731247 RepID=A0A7Y2WB17_9GAMM|nr:prepilin-type N-terminal cleavage/methylation domain-containing protein [Acinetobacter terrae]NNH77872.1 prepilin-type N-terminal cleavage/methylation domain-containing protein [Acinetobacter terrae]